MPEKTIYKYDFKTKKIIPETRPEEWVTCEAPDQPLVDKVRCTNCGAEIKYADSFASRELLVPTPSGFAVPATICGNCHDAEYARHASRVLLKRIQDDKEKKEAEEQQNGKTIC